MKKTARIMTPREPMALKLAKWCRKNRIIDTAFYDGKNVMTYWENNPDRIRTREGVPFHTRIPGGKDTLDFVLSQLDGLVPGSEIGMSSEGSLNHALHYMSDWKLEKQFSDFLARYGYKYACLGNCFYLVYRAQ